MLSFSAAELIFSPTIRLSLRAEFAVSAYDNES